MGYVPLVAFKVCEMIVDLRVLKLFVIQKLLDVEDVFGSMMFHCGLPVAQRVKRESNVGNSDAQGSIHTLTRAQLYMFKG